MLWGRRKHVKSVLLVIYMYVLCRFIGECKTQWAWSQWNAIKFCIDVTLGTRLQDINFNFENENTDTPIPHHFKYIFCRIVKMSIALYAQNPLIWLCHKNYDCINWALVCNFNSISKYCHHNWVRHFQLINPAFVKRKLGLWDRSASSAVS